MPSRCDPFHCGQSRAWRSVAAAAALVAGCVTVPPPPPPAVAPPAGRPVAAGSIRRRRVERPARLGRGSRRRGLARVHRRLRGARRLGRDADALAGAVRRRECDRPHRHQVRARVLREPFYPIPGEQPPTAATPASITGYYEPLLDGARTRSSRYGVPLYAAPDDLLTIDLTELYPELKDQRLRGRVEGKRVVPYWPRADIETARRAVAGKALVYVDDPVEAFFLQIQGSGRVRLDDGSVMRVGYADQNGHPYRSIGRVLVERGELTLERASMQGIRDWGRRNPDKLPALLDENPSYVFFREVPPPAPGTLGGANRRAVRLARRAAARASARSPSIRARFRWARRSSSRRRTRCRRDRCSA